jgi:hypothetical protein
MGILCTVELGLFDSGRRWAVGCGGLSTARATLIRAGIDDRVDAAIKLNFSRLR